jgi:Na+-transporting methylmalonyl-CoA/oxaloacetate decarboxylase gamma subunit
MLVGMGTVFVFLSILVMAMSLMAFIVHRLMPTSAGCSIEKPNNKLG